MNWKTQACILYFEGHLSINDISKQIQVSRQSVSSYLKACDEYEMEQQFRFERSVKRRKQKKFAWDKKNRTIYGSDGDVCACVKREHHQAVAELSRERYY